MDINRTLNYSDQTIEVLANRTLKYSDQTIEVLASNTFYFVRFIDYF